MARLSHRAGPLAGLRIVELATYISAPFGTMMLADLGAEVIKIESPAGDPLRRFGRTGRPLSPLFVNTNRGKRSVVLDLKDAAGRQQLLDLLDGADLYVTNLRPAAADRLGMSDDVVASGRPRLVRVYVSGFGDSGPLAETATFDSVVQAHLGSASHPEDRPLITGSYLMDKIAATFVAQAALAALFDRQRTGRADRVEVSLLASGAYLNFPDAMANRTYLADAAAEAANRQSAATRAIRASDGWIVVVPVSSRQIRRAFEAIGRPQVADVVLALEDAAELTTRLLDELERVTATDTVEAWVRLFGDADVPCGPCLTIDEHLSDHQTRESELYRIVEVDGLGTIRQVRHPARFGGWRNLLADRHPPTEGEHTNAVLPPSAAARPSTRKASSR